MARALNTDRRLTFDESLHLAIRASFSSPHEHIRMFSLGHIQKPHADFQPPFAVIEY